MKKQLSLVMALLLSMLLILGTACSSDSSTPGGDDSNKGDNSSGDKITIRIGTGSGEGNPQVEFMKRYKEYVESESDGKVVVETYPTSQLGTLAQMVQSVQDGSVEMYLMPTSYWGAIVPEVEALELSGLFQDTEHLVKAFTKDGKTPFDELFEKAGITALTWLFLNDEVIASNKEIKTSDDLSGMKIWSNPGAAHEGYLKAFGATPSLLDTGELTSALQNNTVDGAMAGLGLFLPFNIQSVSKYLYMAPKLPTLAPVMANKAFIDGLPDDVKSIVVDGAILVNTKGFGSYDSISDYGSKFQKNAVETMVNDGMILVEPSEADWADIHAKMDSVTAQILKDKPEFQPYYDQLKVMAEETK